MRTIDLLEQYLLAQQRLKSADEAKARAEAELEQAKNALGERMMPPKPIYAHTYCLWVNGRSFGFSEKVDVLLQVTYYKDHYGIYYDLSDSGLKPVDAQEDV